MWKEEPHTLLTGRKLVQAPWRSAQELISKLKLKLLFKRWTFKIHLFI